MRTSRNTLTMFRNTSAEPKIIEYLVNPPSKNKLIELIAAMGVPVRACLRKKGTINSSKARIFAERAAKKQTFKQSATT